MPISDFGATTRHDLLPPKTALYVEGVAPQSQKGVLFPYIMMEIKRGSTVDRVLLASTI